ncbi:MAG: DUF3127 domain-containing protein [Bacteroidaceae bacterium]|nr:DUF3127 domain-containing protein [Bacteroidaceae bacterium]
MIIEGILKEVSADLRSGVSEKTGKQWYVREIVIAIDEPYAQKDGTSALWRHQLLFRLVGNTAASFTLEPGAKVRIKYIADVHQYGTHYYENKNVQSIELCA